MEDLIVKALQNAGGRLPRHQLWTLLPNKRYQPTDEYWEAEQALVDARRVERRRGRNGGIYLLPPSPTTVEGGAKVAQAIAEDEFTREAAHYEPALKTLLSHWTEQPGFTHAFGAITAGQGRRQTGGRWSRPDLVLCTVSDWIFSSRPEGEVRTFEVKRFEALDVLAVYEAVSHKSRAHYSYVLVVNFPEELNQDQESDFDNLLSVAGKQGIGVITARDSADWNTWAIELDPGRSDADHQAVNQLLLDQVPPEIRDPFRAAIRSVKIEINV